MAPSTSWGSSRPTPRTRRCADALPALAGGAGPRPRGGVAGGDRRRQGSALGGAPGVPEEGTGAALHVAQARERGELPAAERAGELAPAAAARLRPADLPGSARRADAAAARTRGPQPV